MVAPLDSPPASPPPPRPHALGQSPGVAHDSFMTFKTKSVFLKHPKLPCSLTPKYPHTCVDPDWIAAAACAADVGMIDGACTAGADG